MRQEALVVLMHAQSNRQRVSSEVWTAPHATAWSSGFGGLREGGEGRGTRWLYWGGLLRAVAGVHA